MSILVIGGTGTVGSEAVRLLVSMQRSVSVLTRSQPSRLPAGAEARIGDLSEPDSLAGAFDGIDTVFLITPLSPRETELGLAAVEAAQRAGVRKLVYLTVHRLDQAAHIPHFGSKLPIVAAIRASKLAYTLIEPNNFFQNDLWLQTAIMEHGVYPQPIGSRGLSRVDVRDIAAAAVRALTEDGYEGRGYALVGPGAWTGPSVAQLYSRALGREIRYAGDDLDAWARQAGASLPDWMVHDLRIMYGHFQERGLTASAEELEQTHQILGRAPRRLEDFVAETVSTWRNRSG